MISDLKAIEDGLDRALGSVLTVPLLLDAAARDEQLPDRDEESIRALGWLGVCLAEEDGGLGLDSGGVISVGAAAGRRLVPVALREEAILVVPLAALLSVQAPTVAPGLLGRLLAGEERGGTVILDRVAGAPGANGSSPAPRLAGHGWLSRGAGAAALLAADRAAVVLLGDAQSAVTPSRALEAGQGFVDITLSAAAVTWLEGSGVLDILRRRRAFLLGEAFGCAERCLDLTLQHTRAREQFGRPIATFQAVAHQLADMTMSVETIRSGLSRLAESWAEDDEGTRDSMLAALSWAAPAFARTVCETAIQLHGGTGFTWEYGLHLYYRRVLQLQAVLGGARESGEAIGRRYASTRRRHGHDT